MREAYNAGKSGDWENVLETFLLGNGKLSAWTNVNVRDCYNEVGAILGKNTDFLRRIIVPAGEREWSPCRTCALTVIGIRWKTASGVFQRNTEEAAKLVVRGVRRPVRLEEPNQQRLDHTGQNGPQ